MTNRTCHSCARTVRHTMAFPVRGVKNVYFCGDHFQMGKTFFCTPCAGQLGRLGAARTAPTASEN
jgi:hypothetical protein